MNPLAIEHSGLRRCKGQAAATEAAHRDIHMLREVSVPVTLEMAMRESCDHE